MYANKLIERHRRKTINCVRNSERIKSKFHVLSGVKVNQNQRTNSDKTSSATLRSPSRNIRICVCLCERYFRFDSIEIEFGCAGISAYTVRSHCHKCLWSVRVCVVCVCTLSLLFVRLIIIVVIVIIVQKYLWSPQQSKRNISSLYFMATTIHRHRQNDESQAATPFSVSQINIIYMLLLLVPFVPRCVRADGTSLFVKLSNDNEKSISIAYKQIVNNNDTERERARGREDMCANEIVVEPNAERSCYQTI